MSPKTKNSLKNHCRYIRSGKKKNHPGPPNLSIHPCAALRQISPSPAAAARLSLSLPAAASARMCIANSRLPSPLRTVRRRTRGQVSALSAAVVSAFVCAPAERTDRPRDERRAARQEDGPARSRLHTLAQPRLLQLEQPASPGARRASPLDGRRYREGDKDEKAAAASPRETERDRARVQCASRGQRVVSWTDPG